MAAANTDLFKKLANNFSTTLSGAIVGVGDSSASLASTTNLATDTGIVLVVDRVNASGVVTPTLREYIVGTISGTSIINLIRGVGNSTAQAHLSGAIVEQVVDQTTINDIITGIRAQHNQDGSHAAVTASSVSATGVINASAVSSLQDASTPLSTYRKEYFFDYIASGGVWSGDSYGGSLNGSMTAIVCYINGQRLSISAVTAHAFTASKDTYIDVLNTAGVGSIVYTEVANNAASPALAANSIRIGIVVSGANILNAGSVNQGQFSAVLPIVSSVPYTFTDSIGNIICPRDPARKLLGYRESATGFSNTSATAATITGLSAPVIVPTGRSVKVSAEPHNLYNAAVANGGAILSIWDGVAGVGTQLNNVLAQGATNNSYPGGISRNVTPTTANKTYTAGLAVQSGGTAQIDGSSVQLTILRIELV